MADLSRLREKIAALRAKTTAAGCTEAEALAAAELAARLMAEHGFCDADIEMDSATATETTVRSTWRVTVASVAATVTNTAVVLRRDEKMVEFMGPAPGPEIAAYLYAVLVNAVERSAREFKDGPIYRRRRTYKTRKTCLLDFRNAMVVSLCARLKLLFAGTMSAEARGRADRALAVRYPKTRTVSHSNKKSRFDGAAFAGHLAAKDVTIAHGVAGGDDGRPLALRGRP